MYRSNSLKETICKRYEGKSKSKPKSYQKYKSSRIPSVNKALEYTSNTEVHRMVLKTLLDSYP